jgi:hypothetical protein
MTQTQYPVPNSNIQYLWRKLNDGFDKKRATRYFLQKFNMGYIQVTGLYSHPGHIRAFESEESVNYPESIATLPPFGPIEGQKLFDQIFSQ